MLYAKEINTTGDVREFFAWLLKVEELTLNPDTGFGEYTMEDDRPVYSVEEVIEGNRLMDRCRSVCMVADVDIYELAQDATTAYLRAENPAAALQVVEYDAFDAYGEISDSAGMPETFHCSHCGIYKLKPAGPGGTGYAVKDNGDKICYRCCGLLDELELMNLPLGQKMTLCWSPQKGLVTNWPGTLVIEAKRFQASRHNWGSYRYEVWFTHKGFNYHGVQVGDNTELLHIQKTKTA